MDFELTRGPTLRAQRVLLYGQHGVGKSTLAAHWPDAVFIDTEDGTGHLDVARLPRPQTWEVLLQEVRWAMDHCCGGSLVIDSADWAERLCTEHVLRAKNLGSIEDMDYGKGYVFVKDEFRRLLRGLDMCVGHAVNVVLVAHDKVTRVTTPDNPTGYDVWGLKLSKHVAPLVKEWADAVLYCHYRTIVATDQHGRGHAMGGTERVMQTTHTATIDAKNRWGLQDEVPMDWEVIAPHIPGSDEA